SSQCAYVGYFQYLSLQLDWHIFIIIILGVIRYWKIAIGSPNDVMLKRPLRDPIFAAAFSTAVHYAHLNYRGPMLMPICSHFCPGLSTSVLSTQMAALRLGISVRHFRV
ncbi:hypothetical protein, partial [Salmonella enterica]